ncbi:MAG: hypothetical protein AB7I38_16420 [Dehalococcoidia bacterium]
MYGRVAVDPSGVTDVVIAVLAGTGRLAGGQTLVHDSIARSTFEVDPHDPLVPGLVPR